MKVFLNIKFELVERAIKYNDDSSVKGAYWLETVWIKKHGPYDTKQNAKRALTSLKTKWTKKGFKLSAQSQPENNVYELYTDDFSARRSNGFESIYLSITELESSREILEQS